jgi:hypothetical protein
MMRQFVVAAILFVTGSACQPCNVGKLDVPAFAMRFFQTQGDFLFQLKLELRKQVTLLLCMHQNWRPVYELRK